MLFCSLALALPLAIAGCTAGSLDEGRCLEAGISATSPEFDKCAARERATRQAEWDELFRRIERESRRDGSQ
jgi:hypothetical protein